jgi:spore germination protein YaaH
VNNIIISSALISILGLIFNPYISPEINCRAGEPLLQLGYIECRSLKTKRDIEDIINAIPHYNVISATGYSLDKNGNLKRFIRNDIEKAIVETAKKHRVSVYLLISARSPEHGEVMLSRSEYVKRAVGELSALMSSENIDGINIDFEYIKPAYKNKLAEFIITLKKAINNKKITMAVFPQTEFPEKYSEFHDLAVIGRHLDEIVLMCYDYHRPGTEAGPVVDIGWAERNIIKALSNVNPDKIWLGVPAYGYRWTDGGVVTAISARNGKKIADKYRATRHKSGTLYWEYISRNERYRVYLSDRVTREKLVSLAVKYHLKGTALWRIGFEEN